MGSAALVITFDPSIKNTSLEFNYSIVNSVSRNDLTISQELIEKLEPELNSFLNSQGKFIKLTTNYPEILEHFNKVNLDENIQQGACLANLCESITTTTFRTFKHNLIRLVKKLDDLSISEVHPHPATSATVHVLYIRCLAPSNVLPPGCDILTLLSTPLSLMTWS
jgi:hypothetical protein